jgi:predicted anti-sigma-YlaC factor YlaD
MLEKGCDRAHAWASLELDGELSELERALLDTHLSRCPECAREVTQMRAVARLMRETPPERPSEPVYVARRSHAPRHLALRAAIAATLAVGAAGLGVLAGHVGGTKPPSAPATNSDIAILPIDARKDVQGLRVPRNRAVQQDRREQGGVV